MTTDWVAGQEVSADALNDRATISVLYACITANTATTGATETAAVTAGGVTFKTGRAYRFTAKALIQSTVVTDRVTIRIRQNTTAGNLYYDTQNIPLVAAGANTLSYGSNICTNTTGADVVATAILLTYVRGTGTGNVLVAATTAQTAYVQVEEIGAAADFPGATAIT